MSEIGGQKSDVGDKNVHRRGTGHRVQNNKTCTNSGITLIALIITIILLIILAGVTLNVTIGENGIITKAAKAKEATERAQALETAQLAYMSSQMENLDKDENTIINEAINELKKQGYIIYTHNLDVETIKTIKYMLNDGQIEETAIKKGNNIEIGLSTETGTTNNVNYYIQVNKKYYLLTINSKEISIGDTEIDINNLENNSGESIEEVVSNNTSIATVNFNNTEKKITITGVSAGETTITTKTSLGQTATLTISVETKLITFTVRGNKYSAEEGMTWYEFVESDYNTGSFSINSTTQNVYGDTGYVIYRSEMVTGDETIIDGRSYEAEYSG